MSRIEILGLEKKVLLHCCCAPCSSAILEWMVNNDIEPTLYFYNPNIYPKEEYDKRKLECIKHAGRLNLEIVDADYDHDEWLAVVTGLEDEPERGRRCAECFKMRLLGAATFAQNNRFHILTTTLTSSRWKDADQVAEAGRFAVSQVNGVEFWAQNWKKNGLSERRSILVKEFNFYNQQYCGCEYSVVVLKRGL